MYKGSFTNHFPTVSVIMTLRGSEGVTLTNCSCAEVEPSVSFFTRRGLAIAKENVGRRPQVLQKSPAPKALCRSTCNRGKQLEQEQEEQQEDTEDSGGESGDDKCMVCGEREEDDLDIEDWVACEMCSQWIHSKFIPSNHPYSISHADFHCHICLQ